MNDKKIVFLTGATGTMGVKGLNELLKRREKFQVRVLARDSRKNHELLDTYVNNGFLEVVWGNLLNYEDIKRGVSGADYVLHVGGMVSPAADYYPEKTMRVNVGSAENIVNAIKDDPRRDEIKLVYIGSVSQLGNRAYPLLWGRAGDPVWGAKYDYYALSKILAERVVAESGLKYWVSLRQTGILSSKLVNKASDPIVFHVPLDSVLEWATDTQSGRLLANICEEDVPEEFWCRFYNIGGGDSFRLTNYEFESMILKAMRCPSPEKIFDTEWFATRNFHGQWYLDSDMLENYLHFRGGETVEGFFKQFIKELPGYYSLAAVVPAPVIKAFMRFVATKRPLGPLSWLKYNDEGRIEAFWGSREAQASIPDWKDFPLEFPDREPRMLNHGYDESKDDSELDIEDMRGVAKFRGGNCMSDNMAKGDLTTPLEWECHARHRFRATPRLILKGGHWCDKCISAPWDYDTESKKNPFFAQVYRVRN